MESQRSAFHSDYCLVVLRADPARRKVVRIGLVTLHVAIIHVALRLRPLPSQDNLIWHSARPLTTSTVRNHVRVRPVVNKQATLQTQRSHCMVDGVGSVGDVRERHSGRQYQFHMRPKRPFNNIAHHQGGEHWRHTSVRPGAPVRAVTAVNSRERTLIAEVNKVGFLAFDEVCIQELHIETEQRIRQRCLNCACNKQSYYD